MGEWGLEYIFGDVFYCYKLYKWFKNDFRSDYWMVEYIVGVKWLEVG